MRKWIVAGLVALFAIGAGTYLLLQPGRGSVEYHKSEYLDRSFDGPRRHWTDMRIVPSLAQRLYWRQWHRQREFHQRALIGAGYLKEAPVAVFKSLPLSEVVQVNRTLKELFAGDTLAFTEISLSATNGMVCVIATATRFEQVADVIREAYGGKTE